MLQICPVSTFPFWTLQPRKVLKTAARGTWDCSLGPFSSQKKDIGIYRIDSHTPLPKRQPQSLTFPLRKSQNDSHRGNVNLGGLWWRKSEQNCRHVEHVKLFELFGTYGLWAERPEKSLTCLTFPQREACFWCLKSTNFNISPAGIKIWFPQGKC